MDIKQFEVICRMPQKALKKYVTKKLKTTHNDIVVDDGYVYAQGDFPVLLVAHMDTVHKEIVKHVVCAKDIISSPQGIGGDDRCGIYMILRIVQEWNCSVLFCEDEEIGGVGANKFADSKLADALKGKFNYIIEFDRKGSNDAVFYDCDNPDFEEFITKEYFKTNYGSFSDISYVAPALECAAVNLSCGYYKAHTTSEYVVMEEVDKSIKEAKKILARTTETDKFEYIEGYSMYDDWYGAYYGYGHKYYSSSKYVDSTYHIYYNDVDNIIREYEVYASSDIEAVGMFCMEFTNLCYQDIVDMFCE